MTERKRGRGPSAERIAQARAVTAARMRGEVAIMPPMARRGGPPPPFSGPPEYAIALRSKTGRET